MIDRGTSGFVADLKDDSIRWIALLGVSAAEADRLSRLSESSSFIWCLLEDIRDPEVVYRLQNLPPTHVFVDAMHVEDDREILASLKRFLSKIPEHRFVFFLPRRVERVELPAYLGRGVVFSADELSDSSGDDRALLKHSRKLDPKYRIEDLILGSKASMKLRESIDYILSKEFCEREWGFRKRHSRGHGVTLMFHGESGTGKTMAAEVVASQLELPLYQVDLSSVVSKWVGETERNLKEIFRSARGVRGILLFDEGDALFGTRTKVEGSMDKYSNLEINFLLQEIEAFDGVVILSTNHEKNMDPAFLRRFTYGITFSRPDQSQRERIWKRNVPAEMPLSEDVDFGHLSAFGLTGGNIRNCVRDAAARAASRKAVCVSHEDFLWAVKREVQKHGLEFDRSVVGEQYWKKVAPEWEFQYFQRSP